MTNTIFGSGAGPGRVGSRSRGFVTSCARQSRQRWRRRRATRPKPRRKLQRRRVERRLSKKLQKKRNWRSTRVSTQCSHSRMVSQLYVPTTIPSSGYNTTYLRRSHQCLRRCAQVVPPLDLAGIKEVEAEGKALAKRIKAGKWCSKELRLQLPSLMVHAFPTFGRPPPP